MRHRDHAYRVKPPVSHAFSAFPLIAIRSQEKGPYGRPRARISSHNIITIPTARRQSTPQEEKPTDEGKPDITNLDR